MLGKCFARRQRETLVGRHVEFVVMVLHQWLCSITTAIRWVTWGEN